MNRVILILIDGCRADALQQVSSANIDSLVAAGASCFQAQTVVPPVTLPCHFSLFTSSHPITHGVGDNTARPNPSPAAAGLFEVLAYHGLRSAVFFTWEPLRNLWAPGSVSHCVCSRIVQRPDSDLIIAGLALDYLIEAEPDFSFIYLERTDFVGHADGWMSPAYLKALEQADAAVGRVLAGLEKAGLRDTYHFILQSDHGGSGHHHTTTDDAVMNIPWIAAGPTIRSDHIIRKPVSITDTTPTLARILGLAPHPAWSGKAVAEIFLE